jgi:hypothetical protein
MRLPTSLAVILLAGAGLGGAAHAEEAAVTPYRPSVSTPAQLPAPGQLELELGALGMSADHQWRYSAPLLFKLAFSERWGILAGGEPVVSVPGEDGRREHGFGDTSLVLKRAFVIDGANALGLELGAKLPTARRGIGSGKADYTLNTIASSDLALFHLDANLNFTRLGLVEPDSGRIQTGLSASLSTPLAQQWSATAELSGTRRHGAAGTAQALVALGYTPVTTMAFDVGVAHGLNTASGDWSVFGGMVIAVGRLW